MTFIKRQSGLNMAVHFVFVFCFLGATATAADLAPIRQRGVLRHIGIPYAHFVRETAKGIDGLDVELMHRFADHLGVRYELVQSTWSEAFGDLTGKQIEIMGDDIRVTGETAIRGDILANGLTVLPWRQQIVDYSIPTFPTGVWLVARADSPIKPIDPGGDTGLDILQVKARLSGRSVLTMRGTCLDPELYDLSATGADIHYFTDSQFLDDVAPAMIDGMAEATLLDIPDALVALQKWPGDVKVIGPVSPPQLMGVAVAKGSDDLLTAFNRFFIDFWNDGEYRALVEKYYPTVFLYLGEFFDAKLGE